MKEKGRDKIRRKIKKESKLGLVVQFYRETRPK